MLYKNKAFKFLGFSINGSQISLSKSRIKKFQKDIEARTIKSKKKNVVTDILLEVNVANEETKFGFNSLKVLEAVKEISKLENVKVKGLMTIAPYVDDPEKNRQHFVELRRLAIDIDNQNIDNISMGELSMGMTGDYCVAVEEGATMVRVGTGLFGARNYSI